jgi:cytidylate kinase
MEYCPDKEIIIAIDGHSSSGKSSFARAVARRLGYVYIDTGAMYRAVTLHGIDHGAIADGTVDAARLVAMLGDIEIAFAPAGGGVLLNGTDVEGRIRSIEVSDAVSLVSQIPEVRAKLVELQQRMGRRRGVVMEGRDIGTVVFPDAELKIFLTADPAVRARRRWEEMRDRGVSLADIERNIRERDLADQQRAVSPLRRAPDALLLDNSAMTPEQQMEWLLARLGEL